MPRAARHVIAGIPYHVTQRGNNRQDVFFEDGDYRVYLEFLQRSCEDYGVAVHGYCLMTNHVHFVATPRHEDSLALGFGRAHLRYALYMNEKRGSSGHLWQNRFYSCALDDGHFIAALLYVERNPMRAGIVRKPWRYEWSSAAAHAGRRGPPEFLVFDHWRSVINKKDWENDLMSEKDMEIAAALKSATQTGRPLGSASFIENLENIAGIRLRALPVGRPKKGLIG